MLRIFTNRTILPIMIFFLTTTVRMYREDHTERKRERRKGMMKNREPTFREFLVPIRPLSLPAGDSHHISLLHSDEAFSTAGGTQGSHSSKAEDRATVATVPLLYPTSHLGTKRLNLTLCCNFTLTWWQGDDITYNKLIPIILNLLIKHLYDQLAVIAVIGITYLNSDQSHDRLNGLVLETMT